MHGQKSMKRPCPDIEGFFNLPPFSKIINETILKVRGLGPDAPDIFGYQQQEWAGRDSNPHELSSNGF